MLAVKVTAYLNNYGFKKSAFFTEMTKIFSRFAMVFYKTTNDANKKKSQFSASFFDVYED